MAKRNISVAPRSALRVAQPALSRQIQDLEREIGFTLFDRLSRGVKLSSAGRLFLDDARRILHQLNEATERAQMGDQPVLVMGIRTRLSARDSRRTFLVCSPNRKK